MGIENIAMIPYKNILVKDNYKDLIYQLQKLIEFIANDGQADFAKSMFNVKGVYPNEVLKAKREFGKDIRDYIPRSLSASKFRFFYFDLKAYQADPSTIITLTNTSQNMNNSGITNYLSFLFGKEMEEDEYLINFIAGIIRIYIDSRFSYHNIRLINSYENSHFWFYKNQEDILDPIDGAEFIYTLYKTYIEILDEVVDLKNYHFDLIYGKNGDFPNIIKPASIDRKEYWRELYQDIISYKDINELKVIDKLADYI